LLSHGREAVLQYIHGGINRSTERWGALGIRWGISTGVNGVCRDDGYIVVSLEYLRCFKRVSRQSDSYLCGTFRYLYWHGFDCKRCLLSFTSIMSKIQLIDDNEEILKIVHKHWFALLREIVLFSVTGLAPIIVVMLFNMVPIDSFVTMPGNSIALGFAFVFVWLVFVLPFVFVVWTDHYLDSLVLTTNRVIEVEQRGLFSREVSSFRLDRVQDVTTEISGLIPTFMNFGTVHIQTAGETRQFIAKYVPNPRAVKLAILQEHNRALDRKRVDGV